MQRVRARVAAVCICLMVVFLAHVSILGLEADQEEELAIVFGGLEGPAASQSGVTVTEAGQHCWILRGHRRDVEQLCRDSGLSYMMGNTVHLAGVGTWTTAPQFHADILDSARLVGETSPRFDTVREWYHIPRNVEGSGAGVTLVTVGYPEEGDINRFAIEEGIGYAPLSFFDRPGARNRVSANSTAVYESVRIVAPQSKIFVFSAESATWTGLTHALLRALEDPWSRILVIPWGVAESSIPQPVLALWHEIFESARQKGIVVIAAAGEKRVPLPTSDPLDYPASDPLVVSVGVVTRTPDHELFAWPGSRAGISRLQVVSYREPNQGHGPDVAMVAAPDSGGSYWIGGERKCVGGSAVAAAMFGGIMADLESQGVLPEEADSAQLLGLLGRYASRVFTDVRSGTASGYPAVQGFDLATGWGAVSYKKKRAHDTS
ncbi:MAG: hypothetical protein IRY98_12055, partial [Alicyclobacillaceae bacterium]|nr:hypothetical protein [Alicyclobacillaceae bacterium]